MEFIIVILLVTLILMVYKWYKSLSFLMKELHKNRIIQENDISEKFRVQVVNDIKEIKISVLEIAQNSLNKQEEKLNYIDVFSSAMNRYKGYLNQSKVMTIDELFSSMKYCLREDMIEDSKIYYISSIVQTLINNGIKLSELKTNSDYYGDWITFNIKQTYEFLNGKEDESVKADLIFNYKDESHISVSHKFYDFNDKFIPEYKQFKVQKGSLRKSKYELDPQNTENLIFRISLDDFFGYINEVGKNYHNKIFFDKNMIKNEVETFLEKNCLKYIDYSWQLDKTNFDLLDTNYVKQSIDKNPQEMTYDELFIHSLESYYCEIEHPLGCRELGMKAVENIKYLAMNHYPLAILVLGIFHIDGKVVLKDKEKAKHYVEKAYKLYLVEPSLKVWNEYNLGQD